MAQVRSEVEWAGMSDDDFVKAAEMQIWLSAFAANNPKAPAHAEADMAWQEAKNRGKPFLYDQAWKRAASQE